MSAKHTPGPWHAVDQNGEAEHCFIAQVYGPDTFPIADVSVKETPEISNANARLIAAAPDLLAICKIFLGHDERFQIAVGGNPIAVDKMLADARAVIAKVSP